MRPLTQREALILAGLYLSKFDGAGLSRLGFGSFTEAFNAIGLSLKGRPASLKNYRDEFDPLFPNARVGWHKRALRKHCEAIYEEFGKFGLEEFAGLLQPLVVGIPDVEGLEEIAVEMTTSDEPTSFARRLITGVAAEGYFEQVFPRLEPFRDCQFINTTRLGCGFDYKVNPPQNSNFLAVEVKGMSNSSGSVMLTEKEHQVANRLGPRYFLFVARNFAEEPFHTIYRDPLNCGLAVTPKQRNIQLTSWHIPIIDGAKSDS